MALASNNHCPRGCELPVGTYICPIHNLPAVNFAGSAILHMDGTVTPYSIAGKLLHHAISGLSDMDWADGLHMALGPLKLAALLSPYIKIRVTAWAGTLPDGQCVRAVTLENRGGWGAGAFGPIRGVSNYWSENKVCLTTGLAPKVIGEREVVYNGQSTTLYAFEQSFVLGWMKSIQIGVGEETRHIQNRKYVVFEQKVTRKTWDRLYDRIVDLDLHTSAPE